MRTEWELKVKICRRETSGLQNSEYVKMKSNYGVLCACAVYQSRYSVSRTSLVTEYSAPR